MTIHVTADGTVIDANRTPHSYSATRRAWSLWPTPMPYNPWISPDWLATGEFMGGVWSYPEQNRSGQELTLRLPSRENRWFSSECAKPAPAAPDRLEFFLKQQKEELESTW